MPMPMPIPQQEALPQHEPVSEYGVEPALFESVCPMGPPSTGGYLQQGPSFSVVDGVSSPHAAMAHLRQLTAENERLVSENEDVKITLGRLQEDLDQARKSLELASEECRSAKSELIATRKRLEDWQRVMEKALGDFQAAEQKHLRELDSAIDTVRTVVDKKQTERAPAPPIDTTSSRRGSVDNG